MHLLDSHLASTVVRLFPSQHWTQTQSQSSQSRSPTPSSDLSHHGGVGSFSRKMELGNILNTKMPSKALIGNPMPYDMQHPMHHDLQQGHPQASYPPPYLNGRIKSETNSERGASPHPSDPRYSNQPQQMPYTSMANGYADQMRYPSPSAGQMGVPNPLMGYGQNAPTDQTYAQQQPSPAAQSNGRPAGDPGPPKAFACSTCGKGFARRSDLARHGEFQVKPSTRSS